ncbi:hypothetical protein DPM33_07870 [Mesorhizobium hawassense]|uniref:Uncharacterized protein n=1 Tax=Mesorhizobium hawassense TaxID=1209954 RepID=A0A330HS60_9HYPH|nr:hypothetical protein [Mesorhizobium hawassense]RAZ91225.1 hypothetical protein DPM33_07870 [Mesorhizobium hawassense]
MIICDVFVSNWPATYDDCYRYGAMDHRHEDDRHDPISVFDLEALREALRQTLRDNGAEAAEWSEPAKCLFEERW